MSESGSFVRVTAPGLPQSQLNAVATNYYCTRWTVDALISAEHVPRFKNVTEVFLNKVLRPTKRFKFKDSVCREGDGNHRDTATEVEGRPRRAKLHQLDRL